MGGSAGGDARALAIRREHGDEEAGEAPLELLIAERKHPLAALWAGADYSCLAQDPEVVREGRLREAEVEHAARALVAVCEPADDLEPGRIAECVEDGRELQLVT